MNTRELDAGVASLSSNLARQIKSRMDELGVSKVKMAHLMDVHPSFVTRILSGKQNMSISTMAKVSLALNCETTICLAALKASGGRGES